MKTYLFFGPPGSAKGTQRKLLETYFQKNDRKCYSIETGALLREYIAGPPTPLRERMAEIMRSGEFVPSALPASMWVQELTKLDRACEIILIDGAGRRRKEGVLLGELLDFIPNNSIQVIILNIPFEETKKRLLLRGRVDDKEGVIRHRYDLYTDSETGTIASINYLRALPSVQITEIDGVGSIEEVQQRILNKIEL